MEGIIADVLNIPPHKVNHDTSFVRLGGTSLTAVRVVKICKEAGIIISISDLLGNSQLSGISYHVEPEQISRTQSEDGKSIFTFDTPRTSVSASETSSLDLPPVSVPLTEMQLSFIAGSNSLQGGNIITHFEEYPTHQIPSLKQAWKQIVETEPIFRTTLIGECQVEGNATFEWKERTVHQESEYDAYLSKQTTRSFVGTWFEVIHLEDQQRSTLIWRVHHALIDGYSAHILLSKVRKAAIGEPVEPGPSYTRVLGDIEEYRIQHGERGKQFWSKRNAIHPHYAGDILPPKQETAVECPQAELYAVKCPARELATYALEIEVTTAAIHHAVWAALLTLYADSDAIVFGAVFAGRDLPINDVESVTGSLVNSLPFQFKVDRDQQASVFLQDVFRSLNTLSQYQWTTSNHGLSRKYGSLLAMQYDYSADASEVSPLRMWSKMQSDLPLSILIEESGNVHFQYDSSKFDRKFIQILAESYVRLCNLLIIPGKSVGDCVKDTIPPHHRDVLLRYGNCLSNNTTPEPYAQDLVSLYETAAEANPDAIALHKGAEQMSYSKMNRLANILAQEIASRTEEGDVVCIYADQSINWLVAVYAVLKARCVYCAINPAGAHEQIRQNYSTAKPKIFIAPHWSERMEHFDFVESWLDVQKHLANAATDYIQFSRGRTTPSANSYLCFTSGSTGLPKGVMCSHEGLVAFQTDLTVRLLARPGWKVSQVMSPAFDGSIHEIFSTLSYGATLVLPSDDLFSHIQEVDAALLTPSVASVLDPVDYPNLKALYLVGEPIPQHVADKWASKLQLYNMYGPTEATGGATIKKMSPNEPVTIGGPNPSSRIYILNSRRELCPPGVVGELFLAGVQVARGYVNRPDETAKRFHKDTVCPQHNGMMYQTGDRGCWNSNGDISLLGRSDRQIKLRGFRLDLNDLEIRMAQAYGPVDSAAVTVVDSQLVALVRPQHIDIEKYRKMLDTFVPRYSIPHHIIPVESFPQTSIGKLDYKAIEKMPLGHHTVTKPTITSTLERSIATIWRELLKLPGDATMDHQSSFSDLGGHSLQQLLMAGRLSKLLDFNVPSTLIFESQSLSDLTESIERLRDSKKMPKMSDSEPLGEFGISPIELEWYQKYELDASSSAFNVSLVYAFEPDLINLDQLTYAWNVTMKRHLILRTRYVKTRRGQVKRKYSPSSPRVQRVAKVDIWKETNRVFNLHSDDLIRVTISGDKVVISISHIICDLTTIQILLQEVSQVYWGKPLSSNQPAYMNTTVWSNHAFPCDIDFWNEYLAGVPLYTGDAQREDYRGTTALCQVPLQTFNEMNDLVTRAKVSYHQLALAAVALALQVDSEEIDVVMGGPYLNRKSDDDMKTVGLYLEPLPIRVRYDPATSSVSYLESVKRQSQLAVARAIPWNQLLDALQLTPDFPDHPILDTMVTFHDDRETVEPLDVPGMDKLLTWTNGAKFKLMVEFTAVSDQTLLLRIEYDDGCYSRADILKLQELINTSLLYLALDLPHAKIASHLRNIKKSGCTFYKQLPHGISMRDIKQGRV